MRQVIRLSDIPEIPSPASKIERFGWDRVGQARIALEVSGLQFNTRTGVTSDNRGELARYCGHYRPIHESFADVMEWEFAPYIGNAASRLERGLAAV